jgi:release factor glutamine methyltransferase
MPADRLSALLAAATARLKAAGCGTPVLDARLLLQAAAGLSREQLILGPDQVLTPEQFAAFEGYIARRERHEPVSRILGAREFYGRVFRVTPDTLDPRPDTETIIDAALAIMPKAARLLDLGTGTGAIAITLLAERPDASGLATDVSPAALAVARENATRLGVVDRLMLVEGSWYAPVAGHFDIILSNPPYIPAEDISALEPEVRNFDPALALSGGNDGLDPYRTIATGAAARLAAGGQVLVEIGAGQAEDVEAIFATAGLRAAGRHRDLGGHDRCLAFNRDEK